MIKCPKCGGVLFENEITKWFECFDCGHQEPNDESLEARVKTLEEKIKIFEKEIIRMKNISLRGMTFG